MADTYYGFDLPAFAEKFLDIADFEALPEQGKVEAICMIQEKYGFEQTGIFTRELASILSAGRRCGVSDSSRMGGGYYRPGRLTYCIDAFLTSPFMNANQFAQGVRWAFDRIEEVCGYSFEQVETTDANFLITWGRGPRAGFPENGPGGVLAHCQLAPIPNYTGQVRCVFDGAEPWVFDENSQAAGSKILVNIVALHEFLHGIGFEHVTERTLSILNPVYNPTLKGMTDFDIKRLQAIAGMPSQQPPTPTKQGIERVRVFMNGERIDCFPATR